MLHALETRGRWGIEAFIRVAHRAGGDCFTHTHTHTQEEYSSKYSCMHDPATTYGLNDTKAVFMHHGPAVLYSCIKRKSEFKGTTHQCDHTDVTSRSINPMVHGEQSISRHTKIWGYRK